MQESTLSSFSHATQIVRRWAAGEDGEFSLTLLASRRRLLAIVLPMLAALSLGAWWSTRGFSDGFGMSFWLPASTAGVLLCLWVLMLKGWVHPHRAAVLMCAGLALVVAKRLYELNGHLHELNDLPAFLPIFAFIPILMITSFLVLPARWALWNAIGLMVISIVAAMPILITAQSNALFGVPQLLLFLGLGLPIVVVSLWALSESEAFREDAFRLAELQAKVEARSKALEQANQGLEAFNYAISHDLRAPLRTISSFMSLILKRHSADMSPEMRELFSLSVDASVELNRMTSSLLEYSRAGTDSAPSQLVDAAEVVEEIRRHLKADVDAQQAELDVDAPELLPFNRAALRQVLQNLIENALKYRHAERTPLVHVRSGRRHDRVWLRVSDNGLGVARDQRTRIFEPFARAAGTFGPGLGIGLATCQRLISAHGGEVRVEDNPRGPGTSFLIVLPDRYAAEARAA